MAGELDAAILPRPSALIQAENTKILALFADSKATERKWFEATNTFPILHVAGVRKSLLQADPELWRRLFDAFNLARAKGASNPAIVQSMDATQALANSLIDRPSETMSAASFPYGIRANRQTLESQIRWSASTDFKHVRSRLRICS